MQDIPFLFGSLQYFISRTIKPSFSSTAFQNFLGISDYNPNCPVFSTIQSYAPNVAIFSCKHKHVQILPQQTATYHGTQNKQL